MIHINEKKDCCGCGACVSACPKGCISMKEDAEGFLYPYIVMEDCIACGLCERVCPVLNQRYVEDIVIPDTYAAYAKSDSLREKSSSGGLFSLIAENVLQKGGVVFGAAFDSDFSVKHIAVDNQEELGKIRGSKYLQSRTEYTFVEAKKILDDGRLVLYTGTACQIAGLKRYLKKEYENLYTIDVLCHGVPSPKFWKKYLAEREHEYQGVVQQMFFRQKTFGWKTYSVSLKFSNSTEYRKIFKEDSFMKLFLANICLRPSCHACEFKELSRPSDITLGDCWGIDKYMPEMDDDKGTSVVLLHSEKGKKIFEELLDKMIVKKGDVERLLPPTADSRKSVLEHQKRKKFFKELDRNVWGIAKLEKVIEPSCYLKARWRLVNMLVAIKHKIVR